MSTRAQLLTEFSDNTTGAITAADLRDLVNSSCLLTDANTTLSSCIFTGSTASQAILAQDTTETYNVQLGYNNSVAGQGNFAAAMVATDGNNNLNVCDGTHAINCLGTALFQDGLSTQNISYTESAPATHTSAGTVGQTLIASTVVGWCLYVCTATNTWSRVLIGSTGW